MRFLLTIVLTALFSYLAGLFLPWWWSFALICFLVALLLPQRIWISFLSGFIALFVVHFLLALWIDSQNQSLLSTKIAQLFKLADAAFLLVLLTAFISALIAGFASMSGSSLRASGIR